MIKADESAPVPTTSEPHRLVVHPDPEDGMDVEHPDSCPRTDEPIGIGNLTLVQWWCDVDNHLHEVGFDDDYYHAFDDPKPSLHRAKTPLLPGVYRLVVETVVYPGRGDGIFFGDGCEFETVLHVTPQPAIDDGYYLPVKCARRSPWPRHVWERAHDQYATRGWRTIVDTVERYGGSFSPLQVGGMLDTMANASKHPDNLLGGGDP